MEKVQNYELGALERTLGQLQRTEMTDLAHTSINKLEALGSNSTSPLSHLPRLQSRRTVIASLSSFIPQILMEYLRIRKGHKGTLVQK